MSGRRIGQLAVSVALVLSVIAAVLWMSDPETVAGAWSELSLSSVVLVTTLLVGGVVLSSLRIKLIAADLGYRLTLRDAAMTLCVGQLAGTAFFQLAGQLIGRGAILTRSGVPAAATVVISGYERAVALSASLLLAGGSALYLFGSLKLNLESGGLSLIKLALGIAAATSAGAALAWGRTVVNLAREVTWLLFFRLLRSFAISLAIQGTTLAAYVALERTLAPQIGIASLIAASCIIMLAASLPISFGGWGLRELSAVVALQAIGLSSASALVVAIMIGLLSLVTIAGTAIVVMLGWKHKARPVAVQPAPAVPDYAAALDWTLPLMAATAVFFQIYVPTGDGRISVNLADPIVVLGGGMFLLYCFGKGWPAWRIPRLGVWVAAASAVILLSMLRGWASFGWTDWAFVNKGLGWLVLLCYGATGALIIRRVQDRGWELLLKTLVASGAAIALVDIGLMVSARVGISMPVGLVEARLAGLSQNPNAFALMLVLVLAAAMLLRVRPAARVGLMAVALVGIWFTGSRAGILAVPVVMSAAIMMGVALRPLLMAAAAAMVAIVGIIALPSLLYWAGFLPLDSQFAALDSVWALLERSDVVTAQHIQTIYDGFAMFLAHPIVGAGLGAYMYDQLRVTSVPLVIHSTAVWLLAETGIVGFAVFFAAALRLFADAVRHRGDQAALLLVLMLCGMAVMSMAHEMLYQRAFWLLLGAALAMPVGIAVTVRRDGSLPGKVGDDSGHAFAECAGAKRAAEIGGAPFRPGDSGVERALDKVGSLRQI